MIRLGLTRLQLAVLALYGLAIAWATAGVVKVALTVAEAGAGPP